MSDFSATAFESDEISAFFCGRYGARPIADITSLLLSIRKMQGDAIILGVGTDSVGVFDWIADNAISSYDYAKTYISSRNTLIELCRASCIDPSRLFRLPPPKAVRVRVGAPQATN